MLHRRLVDMDSLMEDQRTEIANDEYEIIEYQVPIETSAIQHLHEQNDESISKKDCCLLIRTRERKVHSAKLSIQELMSHVHHGVDNTGNTRVWDCSNVLASLIMGEKAMPMPMSASLVQKEMMGEGGLIFSTDSPMIGLKDILSLASRAEESTNNGRKILKVLELGGGMAALPSLALAALENNTFQGMHNDIPYIDVTITDGHPTAVENNTVCSKLTQQLAVCSNDENARDNIHCYPLLWKANEDGVKECNALMKNSQRDHHHSQLAFDLVLVSDCTHFTEFHADLAATIGRLLRIGGVCILCQPRRGESLKMFIELIHAMNTNYKDDVDGDGSCIPLFKMDLYNQYSETLFTSHERLVDDKNEYYDANIHYPLLLTLKKMRTYSEEIDTGKAVHHVKHR